MRYLTLEIIQIKLIFMLKNKMIFSILFFIGLVSFLFSKYMSITSHFTRHNGENKDMELEFKTFLILNYVF